MDVEVRPGGERFVTRGDGRETRHSFSFGAHYDPDNTHFGVLVACNEDRLEPGAGYADHPHAGLEIVTWVLAGAVTHADSTGRTGVLRPGQVQRMSAGTGLTHSERNAGAEPLHLVQMWVLAAAGGVPGHEQRDVTAALAGGELVPVVTARPDAVLHAARPSTGSTVTLPAAPYVHLMITRGSADLPGSGTLRAGDAARLRDVAGLPVTAGPDTELLVWEMRAAPGH